MASENCASVSNLPVRKMIAASAGAVTVLAALSGPAMAQAEINWPTFGGNLQRTSYNASETTLSNTTVQRMKRRWKAKLTSAARYQPDLATQVATPSGTVDLLVVTLFGGDVVALNAATGKTVWSTSLGETQMPCPVPAGAKPPTKVADMVGIGEPATLDIPNGRVYVVDAGGMLHALSLATGTEMAGYPVEVIDAPNLATGTYVHYFSPTLVGTNLYLGTAAFCESKKVSYHGQVIQFSTTSATVVNRYYPMGDGKVLGGGLWGTGGLAVDPDDSSLWGGTANTLPPPQNTGNAEKVIQLDANLDLLAANGPTLLATGDLDFGSTPLLFQPTGCPPMLAAINKSGVMVVYNRTNLSGGPTQILNLSDGSGSGKLIGMASFDPVTNAVYVDNPKDSANGTYLHGLLALQANTSCQLSLLWQQTVGQNGNSSPSVTPTIANGVVYLAESKSNIMSAFDAATGTMLWTSGDIGDAKAAPVVANGQVFVGAGDDVYAFGL